VFVHLAPEGADQVLRFHVLRVAERGRPPPDTRPHTWNGGSSRFRLREQWSGPI
jgi:hypothetical protein